MSRPLPELSANPASRAELEQLLQPLEHHHSNFIGEQHGLSHAASTAILATIVMGNAFPHLGDTARQTAAVAAYMHDAGRTHDLEVRQIPHAKRGEKLFRRYGHQLLPGFGQEFIDIGAAAIGRHSTTFRQRRERRHLRNELLAAEQPLARAQRIGAIPLGEAVEISLIEADVLDRMRLFTTGACNKQARRLRLSLAAARGIPDERTIGFGRRLVLPSSRALIPYADELHRIVRQPNNLRKYRGGNYVGWLQAMLDTGQDLGLIR